MDAAELARMKWRTREMEADLGTDEERYRYTYDAFMVRPARDIKRQVKRLRAKGRNAEAELVEDALHMRSNGSLTYDAFSVQMTRMRDRNR